MRRFVSTGCGGLKEGRIGFDGNQVVLTHQEIAKELKHAEKDVVQNDTFHKEANNTKNQIWGCNFVFLKTVFGFCEKKAILFLREVPFFQWI